MTSRGSDRHPVVGTLAILLVAVLLPVLVPAHALAGPLDPSFSKDGKVVTAIGSSSSALRIGIDTKGRILAAVRSTPRDVVARYTPNGRLDTGFSGDGHAALPGCSLRDLAVQTDNRVVVAGVLSVPGRGPKLCVGRLLPGGGPDPGFSHDGLASTRLVHFGSAVALQADGKVLVAGAMPETRDGFAVARFRRHGGLDPSFSGDGVSVIPLPGRPTAIALQEDGRIVLAGESPTDAFIARFAPNGTVDRTFADDGVVRIHVNPGSQLSVIGVEVRADGRIVVAGGLSGAPGGWNVILASFLPGGSRDASFGRNGVVLADIFGGIEVATGLALQSDGKIVTAFDSSSRQATKRAFAVARFASDGRLDPAFFQDGAIHIRFVGHQTFASDVALQPDGRIVLAGGIYQKQGDVAVAMARLRRP